MEIIIKEGRDKRKAEELEKELDNFEEDFLQASVNTLEADLEDNEDAQLTSFGSGKRRKGRNIFSDSSSDEVRFLEKVYYTWILCYKFGFIMVPMCYCLFIQ